MSSISVIIPNFNRETLIGETIANLLAQTRPADEIIVVDDGSTDGSVKVIQSFGEKIKLLQQSNQGPGAARNAGLQIATGEFIQFQDSDDLYSRNKLEAQARTLEESGADIVFSPWVKLTIDQGRVRLENHVLQQRMLPSSPSLACWCLRGWATVFQSVMFRRSFLDETGHYRTDLMPSEDSEYFFRMALRNPKIAFTDECLLLYRLHTINKISQDEGVSRARRIVDWSHYLRLVISGAESVSLPMDPMTRWLFWAGVRKHLRYLRNVPVSHSDSDSMQFLSKGVEKIPGAWLSAIDLWRRLEKHMSLRLLGSPLMTAYQSSKPTPEQLKLITDLDFQII